MVSFSSLRPFGPRSTGDAPRRSEREHLKDLYMMGNPCQANWPGFKNYVIARLPQLQFLDGEAITRSMQIIAKQQLPKLAVELRSLAQEKRDEKAAKEFVDYRNIDTDEKAPYTPEVWYTASRWPSTTCRSRRRPGGATQSPLDGSVRARYDTIPHRCA